MMIPRVYLDIASVCVLASSMVISGAMLKLQIRIAKKVDADALTSRIEGLEKKIVGMPTQEDMRELFRRLGHVESGVAVSTASLQANTAATARVEHMVDLLVKHQLDKEK